MFSEDSLTWGWHKLCALVLYGSREEEEAENFSYVECFTLYDRVKVTLYDLETELFIVFQLIIVMLYW